MILPHLLVFLAFMYIPASFEKNGNFLMVKGISKIGPGRVDIDMSLKQLLLEPSLCYGKENWSLPYKVLVLTGTHGSG